MGWEKIFAVSAVWFVIGFSLLLAFVAFSVTDVSFFAAFYLLVLGSFLMIVPPAILIGSAFIFRNSEKKYLEIINPLIVFLVIVFIFYMLTQSIHM